jgi:Xaa-Pro dipeptidase
MHLDASKIIVDFNFMNISEKEVYEQGYSKLFSPAGIGHYIGLQVHDIGNTLLDEDGTLIGKSNEHPFLRLRKDIEVGNVFTIEPGIYIIDQLLKPHYGKKEFNWDVIEKFRPYGGARVEDSVYVSEDGIENLTRPYIN